MSKYYVAIDLGATSGRVILGKRSDDKLSTELIHRFPNHLISLQGRYYWDIYELFRQIIDGLRLIARRQIEVTSIGIDTWGVDFVLVASDGQFIRLPISYRDPFTSSAPTTFFQRFTREKLYSVTGLQMLNFNSIFQLFSLIYAKDPTLNITTKILFIPDAIVYMLSGKMISEYTIASTSQLLDVKKRVWAEELFAILNLKADIFPALTFPGNQVGKLNADVQKATGLGAIPIVAVAEHDTASAVVAIPAQSNHFAFLSSGTWSLMGVESEYPILTNEAYAQDFTNEGGVNGTYRFLKNICGMWLLERSRESWNGISYETLIEEVMHASPFQYFIDPDDKLFLNPENMIDAIQLYCSKNYGKVPVSRGEIVRCIFESLCMKYREVYQKLRELIDWPINVLHIIGGGCRNDLMNQWTANAIGVKVIAGPPEATAIGNLMVQVNASEHIPIKQLRKEVYSNDDLKVYYPVHIDEWNTAYQRYKEMTRK